MASLRQSRRTPSRASSLTRDGAVTTPTTARPRRGSLFDNDDDFTLPTPFKKFSLDSKSDFEPIKNSGFRDRMKKISDEFSKAPCWEPSKNFHKSEVSWKTEKNSRGQPIIKKEEVTYTLPETGKTFRRSSITETSSFDSTPAVTSLRTRRSSLGSGEDFSTSRSSVRTRKYSEESSSGLPPRPMRQISSDDFKFSTAQSIRDARKLKNSEELTENIHKMVDKMRSHHLDDADVGIRSLSHTIRSTSVDPFEDDGPRSRSRQRARLNQFSYGVSKR